MRIYEFLTFEVFKYFKIVLCWYNETFHILNAVRIFFLNLLFIHSINIGDFLFEVRTAWLKRKNKFKRLYIDNTFRYNKTTACP